MQTIYLDNAATTFPKPKEVALAMSRYINEIGATVNRSAYGAAQEAGFAAIELRERLCALFNTKDASHAIITSGATAALNQAICGFLSPGDHVLISPLEHNAVTRPLYRMSGVSVTRVPCDVYGRMDVCSIPSLTQANTRMFILSHASNVCGVIQDAAAVGDFCESRGIAFVLDAAQTAGHLEIDFSALKLSALAAPGHKGLYGPQGIGALMLSQNFAKKLEPLIAGGTGSASDLPEMPVFMPDRFEAGTPNLPGIYGLNAALGAPGITDIKTRRKREVLLTGRFLDGLKTIGKISVIGPQNPKERVGVVSVDFKNIDNALASDRLESEYGILTRCGLHCAPDAHRALGTYPRGTVRFSIGATTTGAEIDSALEAISAVSAG